MLAACSGGENIEDQQEGTLPEPEYNQVIVLGDISDDPAEVIEGTQPLADYLAGKLGDFGITEGQVRIASTADEMSEYLTAGEVDIYFDSVYPATLISDATGAQPFLRRWRFGVEEYYSVIFTSKDSGITSVADLPGHVIAMDNPFSTSGFVLPSNYLIGEGYQVAGGQSPSSDEIGFVFSYDDENTLQWVLNGRVDAGATDDYHFFVAFPEDVRNDLLLLAETEMVPRQVAVARPGIDPALLEAITQVLISAHEDQAGQAALEPFQTTRFDQFPEGIEAAQERMRQMMDIVQAIPMP